MVKLNPTKTSSPQANRQYTGKNNLSPQSERKNTFGKPETKCLLQSKNKTSEEKMATALPSQIANRKPPEKQ